MGRLLISSMMACTPLAIDGSMRERLGGWRWITPLRFSLPPRWYELYGSAKYVAMPDCSCSRPWRRACRSARQSAACPIVVVLVDVLVDQREHLPTGVLLPPLGVDGLDLHPAEETLRGRSSGERPFAPVDPVGPNRYGFRPSRPPMVTAAVGMRRRTRALG